MDVFGKSIFGNFLDIIFWIFYMLQVPRFLHIMQLESYQTDGMFRWILKNRKAAFKVGGIQLLVTGGVYLLTTLLLFIFSKFLMDSAISANLAYWLLALRMFCVIITFFVINTIFISQYKKEKKQSKKPLKYTARAKRLMFSNFVILAILQVCFSEFFNVMNFPRNMGELFPYVCNETLMMSFFIFTLPINMLIANFFISPEETWIQQHYMNKARRKLRKERLS